MKTKESMKTKETTRDRVVTLWPDDDLLAAMEQLRERDGVPFSQLFRRALRTWLESKDMLTVPAKRAPRTRPRGLPSWGRHEWQTAGSLLGVEHPIRSTLVAWSIGWHDERAGSS